jgi:hypothetical protein
MNADLETVLGLIDEIAPAETPTGVSAVTHFQAMACLACGLAGACPPEHFPQRPGLWDLPCPQCGKFAVWVTQAQPK